MKLFITSSLVLAFGFAGAQTIVSGTVNNSSGQPVKYAFVRDVQHNKATFTDSTGVFKLNSDPSSSLLVLANNYEDKELKINGSTSLSITLASSANQGSVASLKSGESTEGNRFLKTGDVFVIGRGAINTQTDATQHTGGMGGGDGMTARQGFVQEPTRGSRYLFDDWVPGYGIDKSEKIVVEKTNLYNYDKISGNLLYTNDGKSMTQISPGQLSSFTLYDKKGHTHLYESAPDFSKKTFVEVLLKTPKYKIYKHIDTRLSRADYHTDGVLQMGNRYDEYIDNDKYFFVGEDGKAKSISLKKGNLKKILGADADAFIASQGSRDVDEEYVKDLGKTLSR